MKNRRPEGASSLRGRWARKTAATHAANTVARACVRWLPSKGTGSRGRERGCRRSKPFPQAPRPCAFPWAADLPPWASVWTRHGAAPATQPLLLTGSQPRRPSTADHAPTGSLGAGRSGEGADLVTSCPGPPHVGSAASVADFSPGELLALGGGAGTCCTRLAHGYGMVSIPGINASGTLQMLLHGTEVEPAQLRPVITSRSPRVRST